jgi:hypothetical protein
MLPSSRQAEFGYIAYALLRDLAKGSALEIPLGFGSQKPEVRSQNAAATSDIQDYLILNTSC